MALRNMITVADDLIVTATRRSSRAPNTFATPSVHIVTYTAEDIEGARVRGMHGRNVREPGSVGVREGYEGNVRQGGGSVQRRSKGNDASRSQMAQL